jgi:hypothetical protein
MALRNPTRRLKKIVAVLDAAYDVLNDMGTDDDVVEFVRQKEDPMLEDFPSNVEDAMQALIKVLNPLEKLIGYDSSSYDG